MGNSSVPGGGGEELVAYSVRFAWKGTMLPISKGSNYCKTFNLGDGNVQMVYYKLHLYWRIKYSDNSNQYIKSCQRRYKDDPFYNYLRCIRTIVICVWYRQPATCNSCEIISGHTYKRLSPESRTMCSKYLYNDRYRPFVKCWYVFVWISSADICTEQYKCNNMLDGVFF